MFELVVGAVLVGAVIVMLVLAALPATRHRVRVYAHGPGFYRSRRLGSPPDERRGAPATLAETARARDGRDDA